MSLGEFRDAIESRSMPGCGAAAASAAATGLALVLKGLRLSAQKTSSDRDALIERADILVDRLAGLADEDVAAFKAYLFAQKGQPDEGLNNGELDEAIQRINQVPLDTARTCLEALELTHAALTYTKTALHSDSRAGAYLLHASLGMVLLNVDANLDNLNDAPERRTMTHERQTLQAQADRLFGLLSA